MKRFLICMASLAIFLPICVFSKSQTGPPKGPMGMDPITIMDTDGDGKISLSEWTQFHQDRFNEMDTDGDGYLSETELQKHPGPK
jgi:hypothetical protein